MVWIPGFGRDVARQGNRVGDAATDFTLPDQDGNPVTLSEQVGEKPVVLVFYPIAGSPVCTKQMCSLRDGWGELMSKANVFGLSYDGVEAVKKFKTDEKLPFTLLSDSGKQAAKAYGVVGMFAVARVTFVVGTDGKIKSVISSIKASNHAQQILEAL